MRSSIPLFGALTLSMVLAAGCARQAEVIKMYDDSDVPAKRYKRLLVVDVSSDLQRQRIFENEIVSELRDTRASGVAAHPALTFEEDVPRQVIIAYGDEIDADGILLTSFVSVEAKVEVEEGRTDIRSSCRGGTLVDYFLYDHDVIREPDSIKAAYDVVVISSLYDIATSERVWSIQSTCFDKSSMSGVLRDEARVIVKQLRIDELI